MRRAKAPPPQNLALRQIPRHPESGEAGIIRFPAIAFAAAAGRGAHKNRQVLHLPLAQVIPAVRQLQATGELVAVQVDSNVSAVSITPSVVCKLPGGVDMLSGGTDLLFKVSREPYAGASVTGLTNLLYEVKRLTMHIQPVTCLLRKSSSGAYRHQSLKNSYRLLIQQTGRRCGGKHSAFTPLDHCSRRLHRRHESLPEGQYGRELIRPSAAPQR